MANPLAKRIEQYKEKHAATLARQRAKAKALAISQQHTFGALATAWAFGAAKKNGVEIPSVGGVDPKLLVGGACLVGSMMLKGNPQTKRILASVADGSLAVVAYNMGLGEVPFEMAPAAPVTPEAAGYAGQIYDDAL